MTSRSTTTGPPPRGPGDAAPCRPRGLRRHRGVQGLRAAAPASPSPATTSPSSRPRPRCEFVGAATWAALSGKPVSTDVWSDVHEVPHVRIGQSADLVVVAPATADLLAKAAHGLADDLLTNTLLTARCPVVFAPAMHTEMWEHAATQANVATLRERGALVIEPAEGRLTGADTGKGRLPEPAEIFERLPRGARPRRRATARPRRPARRRLRRRHPRVPRPGALPRQPLLGAARATRWPGPPPPAAPRSPWSPPTWRCPTRPASRWCGSRPPPSCATRSLAAAAAADAVVMAAAPADFRPGRGQRRQDQEGRRRLGAGHRAGPEPRHPRTSSAPTGPGPGRSSSASPPRPATTPARCSTSARAKLARKGCDLLVVNDVSGGAVFGSPDNEAVILGADGAAVDVPRGSKTALAHVDLGPKWLARLHD